MLQRSSGVLLHLTSLPGPFGVGDMGPEADAFLNWAQGAGQRYWQILPLGPVGASGSPFSSPSSFAGNPLLLSPELLAADGLLTEDDLAAAKVASEKVDFRALLPTREALLRKAWRSFREGSGEDLEAELTAFCRAPQQVPWLEDWALFSALRDKHHLQPWWAWEKGLARRHGEVLARARGELRDELAYHRFVQFFFHRQWRRLRQEAHKRGILLFGDLPIYGALDSADVWARPDLFELGEDLRPIAVAGVPPDDFSATGQRWGNPLYRWRQLGDEGFRWWIHRVAANLARVDLLRLDHFRGFESYWRVPAGEATAEAGEWRPGPGRELFQALEGALGPLPFVAEDLGVITPQVRALRRDLDLPGMAILQFAFGEGGSDHSPEEVGKDRVIYTGTHDNETTLGWFRNLDEETQNRVLSLASRSSKAPVLNGSTASQTVSPDEIPWSLIRSIFSSEAQLAVVPAQDLLSLGNEARMNIPGVADGNWSWRLRSGVLTPALGEQLLALTKGSGRRNSI